MIEQQVVVGERAGVHADLRQFLRGGQEVLPQVVRVGQFICGQQLLQVLAQGGLAILIVRQRQQPDHAPAGIALVERRQQCLEGAAVGSAGNNCSRYTRWRNAIGLRRSEWIR